MESEESCCVSVILAFAVIVVITFLLLFKNTVAAETWRRQNLCWCMIIEG